MIAFHLEDVNEVPLRHAAVKLGIPNVPALSKGEVVALIEAKLSPNAPFVLTPPRARRSGWRSPAAVLAALALAVAVASAVAAWWWAVAAMSRLTGEFEAGRREVRQKVRVYDILARAAPAEQRTGLTFDEIRARYADDAAGGQGAGAGELPPDELMRALTELIAFNLVAYTTDSRYVVHRTPTALDCGDAGSGGGRAGPAKGPPADMPAVRPDGPPGRASN